MLYKPVIQPLQIALPYQVDVLRLDLLHPEISGNKWFKLKHNLAKAKEKGHTTLLTFGGAHSNHIAATAACAKHFGLKSIGVIRGSEQMDTATLKGARQNNMQLHFVSRNEYAQKNESNFIQGLKQLFGDFYFIPEGGDNTEGALGCMEILEKQWPYHYIVCACGTGTTFSGLAASANKAMVIGISVLKGKNTLPIRANQLFKELNNDSSLIINGNEELEKAIIQNHCIITNYSFSGYAAFDKELIGFKKQFEHTHQIPLDYVYTNKLFYGAFDLMQQKKLTPNSKLLIIHSGGLQGNKGFEQRFGIK